MRLNKHPDGQRQMRPDFPIKAKPRDKSAGAAHPGTLVTVKVNGAVLVLRAIQPTGSGQVVLGFHAVHAASLVMLNDSLPSGSEVTPVNKGGAAGGDSGRKCRCWLALTLPARPGIDRKRGVLVSKYPYRGV